MKAKAVMSSSSGPTTTPKDQSNTVFVRFVPPSDLIRRHHLEDLFSQTGPLKKCSVIHSKKDTEEEEGSAAPLLSSYGFVKYTTSHDAELAAVQLNNRTLTIDPTLTVTVKVELAQKVPAATEKGKKINNKNNNKNKKQPKAAQSSGHRGTHNENKPQLDIKKTNRLIVRNLSFYAKEKDIRDVLERKFHDTLEEVHIPTVQGNKSRGFCFVTFTNPKAAMECAKCTDDIIIKDRKVQISRALHKTAYQSATVATTNKGEKEEEHQKEKETKDHDNENRDDDDENNSGGSSSSDDDDDDDDNDDDNNEDDHDHDSSSNKTGQRDATAVQEQRCLFIRDLPFDVTRYTLFETFRKYGKITSIYLVKNQDKIPTGSAFVSFESAIQANKVLTEASGKNSTTTTEQQQTPESGVGIVLQGRKLRIDLAVDKETAQTLKHASKDEGNTHSKAGYSGYDRRNLYLLTEGKIASKSEEERWDRNLPDSDIFKRQSAWSEKNIKLQSPLFYINPNRLSIRNLAKHVDEKALKKLCASAVQRGLKRNLVSVQDQINHWKASGMYTTREMLQKVQQAEDEDAKSRETDDKKTPSSLIPIFEESNLKKYLPSVFIQRDIGAASKAAAVAKDQVAPSRGFGFAEFTHHIHALACLRELNNSTDYSADYAQGGRAAVSKSVVLRRSKKKKKKKSATPQDGNNNDNKDGDDEEVKIPRLIVEFTVENKAKAKQQAEHRAQQQTNMLKQREEVTKEKKNKTKNKKKSRGKIQRERKRKEREEQQQQREDESGENDETGDELNKQPELPEPSPMPKFKPVKPPKKKKKVDEPEQHFSKLVQSYKEQFMMSTGTNSSSNDKDSQIAKKRKDKRWFE